MDDNLSGIIQELDDISLALLTCLVASQHLIIYGSQPTLSTLEATIARIVTTTFPFTCATITCTPTTTVNELSEAVVVEDSSRPEDGLKLDTREIANVVIARDLDRASEDVQIQALEIMRQRRVLSHTAIHAAPKQFLFVALLASPDLHENDSDAEHTPWLARNAATSDALDNANRGLIKHINDHFFISHTHDPYNEVDEDDDADQDSLYPRSSTSSDHTASNTSVSTATGSQTSIVIHSKPRPSNLPSRPTPNSKPTPETSAFISTAQIAALATSIPSIRTTAELRRYAHDIVTYLRMHRAVAGGISAISARHLDTLARVLALLHGIAYVTPPLVQLAARKVFAHRVVLATPATERSMQWGSDRAAVARALQGVTAADVLADVLETVPCPL